MSVSRPSHRSAVTGRGGVHRFLPTHCHPSNFNVSKFSSSKSPTSFIRKLGLGREGWALWAILPGPKGSINDQEIRVTAPRHPAEPWQCSLTAGGGTQGQRDGFSCSSVRIRHHHSWGRSMGTALPPLSWERMHWDPAFP